MRKASEQEFAESFAPEYEYFWEEKEYNIEL